ncbi:MAG TPA: hypothetical protein V6D23_00255, partial [Candidatus Obscuribacterales bacterium]
MPQITSAPQLMDLCQKQPELCNAIKSDSNTTIIVINQESSLAKDVADVKKPIDKGLVPSGKGLLIGGGTGAAVGSGLAATLSHNLIGVYGDYTVGGAASVGAIMGGVSGAVAGTIAANFTDNKVIAGAIGGVIGGVATFMVGGGWLLGGLAGAA